MKRALECHKIFPGWVDQVATTTSDHPSATLVHDGRPHFHF